MENLPLLEHQREGIEWIRRVGRGLLADEPGLGKTRTAIEAFDGGRNLIIAPKLVLEGGTWRDELRKWSADPDNPEKWVIFPYTSLNQRQVVPKQERASTTQPIKRLPEEIRRGRFDAMILDEAHYIKGRKTLWTWASKQLGKRADATLLLTGTPFPNWSHEIFSILQMIHPDEMSPGRRFGSFWRWAEQWFDCKPNRFSKGMPVAGEMLGCIRTRKECSARPATDPCKHYIEFAQENLGERYLRHWREDCLDLPPMTDTVVETPMAPAVKKAYLSLKKDFYATFEGNEIIAWNQGAKNVQLHKITTSPWLLNPVGPPKGGKLDMLKYDLENRTRPTLVFAHYQDSVEACASVAKGLGLSVGVVHGSVSGDSRSEAMEAFKTGHLDVLCGSLETLSEGHTFTVADMCILVEESFKPSRNEQAIFRVYRMGQERPVTIKRYLTPNSVDMRKHRILKNKTDQQMRTMTAAEFGELL